MKRKPWVLLVGPEWTHRYPQKKEVEGELKAAWRQRQTLERYNPQAKEHQGTSAATRSKKWQGVDSRCQLDFGLVASRTVRKQISIVWSHKYWSLVLQQQLDTNTDGKTILRRQQPFCQPTWLKPIEMLSASELQTRYFMYYLVWVEERQGNAKEHVFGDFQIFLWVFKSFNSAQMIS